MIPFTVHRSLFPLLIALVVGSPAAAQIPFDSVPADTTQLPRDSVDQTELFLKAQTANQVRLPALPTIGNEGPLPAYSRIVITRDSIEWTNAQTLSDLLQKVPGVYLWRGGWIGRYQPPNFRARGPTSVEYLLDGLPFVPMGPDSLGVDPTIFALSMLSRVEIERWPEGMRVRLYTRRVDRNATVSRIGISAGDDDVARYIGALERRYKNGIGFGLDVERLVSPTATGSSSDFDMNSLWLQAGYVPNPKFGIQAQLLQNTPDRKPYLDINNDTLDQKLYGTRRDAQLRLYWRKQTDELGPRVDFLLGATIWDGSGVNETMRQGGVIAAWRTPTLHLEGRAFNRSRWTPWDLSANAGWAPNRWFTAAGEAGYQKHDLDRHSQWIGGRAGIHLPYGVDLTGMVRSGSVVEAPTILKDQAQDFTDWQGTVGWEQKWIGLELGYGRTDAFRPFAYQPFLPTVDSIAPSAQTEWVTVNWRLTPLQWFTLDGWYSNPRGRTPEGLPPTHSLSSATIRSKFWRSFPSGIFDFKLQGTMESWGDGVIGRDPTGSPIQLKGATFFRGLIEIQLDRFTIYWDRMNLKASKLTYVPGFDMPQFGSGSTFGVRWEFSN
ncbi:MAG TPA: TonB-dependent receptor [Gemmatimonadales bacterium]|jgi:hypothetical protein